MSNITLNIVAPGSGPTPDPVVPNTGLFTHGIGGPEATIIAVSTILILALVATAVWYYKKHTNIHLPNITKHIKTRKSIAIGLTVLAILVSAGTFASLLINAGKSNTNAAEGEDSSLTVDVSSEELTVEVGDEPVFAVLPVDVTVEEATLVGYTLTAYTDSTDLVSTTNPDSIIPMVTLPENSAEALEPSETAGELSTLTDNTYGLALGEEPTSKDEAVYTALSIDSEEPTIIKSMTEYTPTAENDTTTIYYGFYITPDMPYGTYTNDGEVYYNATINTTPVTFDGKGLYFDEEQTQSTNTVEYIAVPQEQAEGTINQLISGEYKTPSQSLPYRFLGWSTDPTATEPTYTSEDDIAEHLPISPNIPLTLYAVWQKATTITYDNNGGAGEMDTQTIIAGESANLFPNTFTKDGYTFNGWNTRADGEGKSYADKELYQAEAESANVTLFAQWKKNILYMQKVSEWGSSLKIGDEVIAVDNRDDKEYYVARLADNNIWMTQNLDLCISCEGTAALTSQNTDLNESGNGIYTNGYTNADNIISYTPAGTAKSSTYIISNNTVSPAFDTSSTGAYTPYSAEGGDIYIYTSNTSSSDTIYTSLYECTSAHTIDECAHYHVGNYYNWSAAIASNDARTLKSEYSVASNSICPAGWRLPKGLSSSQSTAATREFGQLFLASGITSDIASTTYDTDGFNKLRVSPLYFSRGGCVTGSELFGRSRYGYYWSSTVNSTTDANVASFGSDFVSSASNYNRYQGYQIRCIVR